jgi:hypothetical protein
MVLFLLHAAQGPQRNMNIALDNIDILQVSRKKTKSLINYNSTAAQLSNNNSMKFPWNIQKKKTDTTTQPVPDKPKCEFLDITARYFMLDKGCPGDSKTLVKFDGSYCRWISQDKKWFMDPTITNEDWKNGCLRSIPREEAEKILNS